MDKAFCSICGTELIDHYCHHCGQKNTGKKLNFFTIAEDLASNIFTLERSVFATILKIFSDPFKVINNYWQGNRNYYQSPGKLVFYALTVLGLHVALIGNHIMGVKFSARVQNKVADISQSLIFFILFIPMFSLTSYFSFFKRKHNFAEHFIATIYLASSLSILIIISDDILRLFFGDVLQFTAIFIFITMLFAWNARIYCSNIKWNKIVIYTLLQYMIFIGIITLIICGIYLFNPESVHI